MNYVFCCPFLLIPSLFPFDHQGLQDLSHLYWIVFGRFLSLLNFMQIADSLSSNDFEFLLLVCLFRCFSFLTLGCKFHLRLQHKVLAQIKYVHSFLASPLWYHLIKLLLLLPSFALSITSLILKSHTLFLCICNHNYQEGKAMGA